MTAFALDVVLAILLVSYGYTGYRHGFVVSVMSLIGFLCGGALGMWLLPELLRRWHTVDENVLWRTTALVFGVFVFASLGQAVAVGVGSRLRSGLRIERARAIDSILGALATVLAVSMSCLVHGRRGPRGRFGAVGQGDRRLTRHSDD